jgi:hypothetical protein
MRRGSAAVKSECTYNGKLNTTSAFILYLLLLYKQVNIFILITPIMRNVETG